MLARMRPKTDLRTLIALLAITSIVITLANTLYAHLSCATHDPDRKARLKPIALTLPSWRAPTTSSSLQLAQSQLHCGAGKTRAVNQHRLGA